MENESQRLNAECIHLLTSRSPFSILHSPFSILHSPFSILHSPFSILHSPFSILHSPFSIFHSPFSILHFPFSIFQRAGIPFATAQLVDHAVSLVQSYLQLNGYFTSAEYPILAATGKRAVRTMTDVDILAFRFPASGSKGAVPDGMPHGLSSNAQIDPGLGIPEERIDMIIGEVKEGKVNINSATTDPDVLRSVIRRFGCAEDENERVVAALLQHGNVIMSAGYQIRIVAFGAMPPDDDVPPCRIISLGHVLRYLQDYVRRNWATLRHVQFKDPAFGFLMTLEKARRGEAGRRGAEGVEIVPPKQERKENPHEPERRGTGNPHRPKR